MGILNDADLRRPARAGPRPVGAVQAKFREASATVIQQVGDDWDYGDEVPLQVLPNDLRTKPLGEGTLYWSGIEAKVVAADWPEFAAHDIVAALPPSHNWYACARLRPPGRQADLLSWAGAGKVSDPPGDPFEKDHGWWTARLDDPMRLHWENGENLGDGYLLSANPNHAHGAQAKGAVWHFGICGDARQAVDRIFIRPWAGHLWQEAMDGTRFERIRDAYHPVGRLEMTVEARKLVEPVLRGAIWQALAGRPAGSTLTLRNTVRKAFTRHLENYLRRLPLPEVDAAAFAAGLSARLKQGKALKRNKATRVLLSR